MEGRRKKDGRTEGRKGEYWAESAALAACYFHVDSVAIAEWYFHMADSFARPLANEEKLEIQKNIINGKGKGWLLVVVGLSHPLPFFSIPSPLGKVLWYPHAVFGL